MNILLLFLLFLFHIYMKSHYNAPAITATEYSYYFMERGQCSGHKQCTRKGTL